MKSTLLCLCLFAHACAALNEERETSGDALRHQKKNVVADVPKRPKGHIYLQQGNGIYDLVLENKEKEIQRSAANKMLPIFTQRSKAHPIKVALMNEHGDLGDNADNAVLEKSDTGSIIGHVSRNTEGSGDISFHGNTKQGSKCITVECIHHDTLGAAKTEASGTKTNIGKDGSRHEHSSLVNASGITDSGKDASATLGPAGGTDNTGTGKGASSDTVNFDHLDNGGSGYAESISEGEDAGISSGADIYYPDRTTPMITPATDRDGLTHQHSHDSGRGDGDRSNRNVRTTAASAYSKAKDEGGLGLDHPERVRVGYTEASGKLQDIGCTIIDSDIDNRKGTDCKKARVKNTTCICIKAGNTENTREILDEDTGSKRQSYKDVLSGNDSNVNVHNIQITKGSSFLKGQGSYLHIKTGERNAAKSRDSRQGRRYFGKIHKDLGNRPRKRDFQKHDRSTKRRILYVHRKDVSSASSESSSESGEYSSSDSDQSK